MLSISSSWIAQLECCKVRVSVNTYNGKLGSSIDNAESVVIGKKYQIHGKLKPFEAIEAPRQQEGWHEFKNYIQLMPGRRRDLIGLTPLEYTELNWQSRRSLVLLVLRVIVAFRESWVATAALILQASMCEGFIPTRLQLHVLEWQWVFCVFLDVWSIAGYYWIFWYSFFLWENASATLFWFVEIHWDLEETGIWRIASWKGTLVKWVILGSKFPTSYPQEMKVDDLLMISKLGQEQSDPSNCSVPWGFADVRARVGSCVPETKVGWAAC